MTITKNSENLYSSMRFVGDGVTKRVPLTFDLRGGDGLAVDFGEGLVTSGYLVDYDVTPVVVLFSEPLPKGKTITIRRLTKIDTVKHVFQWTGNAQGGADFSAKNVDENFEQITRASQDAMDAQTLASETLEGMAGIRDTAIDARDKAKQSETNAKQSELNSKDSELKSKTSKNSSKISETNSKQSELNAKASELEAKDSETNAHDYEVSAKESASKAKVSETNSAKSETNAKSSELKSKVSETNAKASETKVKDSEVNARASESNSKASEVLSKKWATNPVNVPVVNGEYSAYHWASKARDASTGITPEVQDALDKKWDIQTTVGTGPGVMKTGAGGWMDSMRGAPSLFDFKSNPATQIINHLHKDASLYQRIFSIRYASGALQNTFVRYPYRANADDFEITTNFGGDIQTARFYSDVNTRTDKNNVLHAGTSTPINTLNVSDMSQEVINNDLLTVTSGAVYRVLQPKADLTYVNTELNKKWDIQQTVGEGSIVRESSLPEAIDYNRTCALGAEQKIIADKSANYLMGFRDVPSNSVITKTSFDGVTSYIHYRPILRTGW